jgi:hypothetical protein
MEGRSMTVLSGAGLTVTLPAGWEGQISGPGGPTAGGPVPDVADHRYPVLHVASFPLPVQRGDYGGGALALMTPRDVFVALLEDAPNAAGKALYTTNPYPGTLAITDFDPNALQRPMNNQSGCQRFFVLNGRPFCLYVVLGNHLLRSLLIGPVNAILASLQVTPA